MIKPAPLKKGDLIGIAASASPFDRNEFEGGVCTLQKLGFKTFWKEDLFAKEGYLAGSDERRANELMELFLNPNISAIFFARGGYGSARILSRLDFDAIRKHPKIVMGYSDITSLLIAFEQQVGMTVFHGPVVAKGMCAPHFKERAEKSLLKNLTQTDPLGFLTFESLEYLCGKKACGTLTGGCLSLITASLGTSFEIETNGKILFLEDVNEKLYKIDRMLLQLKLAKKFEHLAGVLIGPLEEKLGASEALKKLLLDYLGELGIPVVIGFPSGHLNDMVTLPLGVQVALDAASGGVEFLESGVGNQDEHN